MKKQLENLIGVALLEVTRNSKANYSLGDVHTDLKSLNEKLKENDGYLDGSGLTRNTINQNCREFVQFCRGAPGKAECSHYLWTLGEIVSRLHTHERKRTIQKKLTSKSADQLAIIAEKAILALFESDQIKAHKFLEKL